MRFVAALVVACSALLKAASPAGFTNPMTVLVDFEKPHPGISLAVVQHELSTLMDPVGVKVDLQLKSAVLPTAEFAELVIFKVKGSCSMNPLASPSLLDERGPLAMTYSSDGEMLHFGEVECDRIRQALEHLLGHGDTQRNEHAFGTALGRVISHEIYHMMANSKKHTKDGVTKETLSARELTFGEAALPVLAREALGRGLTTHTP